MSRSAQLAKFLTVGGGATLVHIVVALTAHALGTTPLWSNFLAFLVALAVSYAGNWYWTFGALSPHVFAIPRFLALSFACFAINHLLVFLIAVRLQQTMWLAMVAVVIVVPALSYWLQKTRVFLPGRANA